MDPRVYFAGEVEHALRGRNEVVTIVPVPQEYAFDVTTTSRGQTRVYMENAFAETREMSEQQRRHRIAMLTNILDAPNDESWEEARATFVPALRATTYGLSALAMQPDAHCVRRPFLPYVDVLVAMDRPTTIAFVNRPTLRRWNVSEEQVFAAAAERMSLLANPSIALYDESHGPAWIVTSDDSYESSRLLLPGWLASFHGRVLGRPIAIVPDRATLLVGGDGRDDMVAWLLEKAEREFAASTRSLSPALYTVDDRGWVVPYYRAANDALAQAVCIAHEKLAMFEHAQQKELLDRMHVERDQDIFVASYKVFQAPDGQVRSTCVWTKGVRAYLPQTQRVMLLVLADDPKAPPSRTQDVPFDSIRGRLTLVPDTHPPRYETTGAFPD